MNIEIIAIGEEVLRGAVVNTNTAFLSQALFQKGWKATRHTALPDDFELLKKGLQEALARSELVITTGGLGSTVDDCTKQAAASIFSSKPIVLANPVGEEPGLIYEGKESTLILLPGVPIEMQALFSQKVVPYLEKKIAPLEKLHIDSIHFCLLRENTVDPLLRELQKSYPSIEFGIYPHFGTVTVCLLSKDQAELKAAKEKLKSAFATHYFPSQSGKIEEALQEYFISHKKTLALAESITGGSIGARLVSIPGSSEYFLGSLVVYANQLKENLLHVKTDTLMKYGAVSSETVKEMLEGLFIATQADYGIAVSGIAGPSGGSDQKPVGTVWAAIGERGKAPDVWTFKAKWDREKNILFTSGRALGSLWRKLAYDVPPEKYP